jgi:putative glutamine amidotransferase
LIPKIIVPLSVTDAELEPVGRTHSLKYTYLNKIMSAGLMPLPVSPLMPDNILSSALKESSGILLTGGADINPDYYHANKHPETIIAAPERDSFEIKLAQNALDRKIPILGICRGHQVMAVASGGTLIQHIPELKVNEQHTMKEGSLYNDIVDSSKHKVIIEKYSRASKILGKSEIEVNSYHHQAVEKHGDDFKVSGRSPEGIIEITEHNDPNYFAFSVQSHPEVESGDLEPLLNEFFYIAKHYQ